MPTYQLFPTDPDEKRKAQAFLDQLPVSKKLEIGTMMLEELKQFKNRTSPVDLNSIEYDPDANKISFKKVSIEPKEQKSLFVSKPNETDIDSIILATSRLLGFVVSGKYLISDPKKDTHKDMLDFRKELTDEFRQIRRDGKPQFKEDVDKQAFASVDKSKKEKGHLDTVLDFLTSKKEPKEVPLAPLEACIQFFKEASEKAQKIESNIAKAAEQDTKKTQGRGEDRSQQHIELSNRNKFKFKGNNLAEPLLKNVVSDDEEHQEKSKHRPRKS